MQAKLWAPGDLIGSSETPIFFKAADQVQVTASILASKFLPAAFSILPNGQNLIEFIGPYTHWLQCANIRSIISADHSACVAPVAAILEHCNRISNSFSDYDADGAIAGCTDLSSLLTSLPVAKAALVPPKIDLACDLLLEFAVDCLKPLEYGTPFVHMGTADQHKSWWKASPTLLMSLKRVKKKRSVVFAGQPSALLSLDRWIDDIVGRIERMHARPPQGSQRFDAIVEASAYCSAIAERHLIRCHYGQAILHLHRALDLLLFAVCDGRGIIDHTQYGGKYEIGYEPAKGSNKIGLLNSLGALDNFLAPHASRESDFRALNDWRNLLMQTHYMTGLDDLTARGMFGRIRPHLQSLGASQWQTAQHAYLKGLPLTIADLLDVDQALSSTVQQIAY